MVATYTWVNGSDTPPHATGGTTWSLGGSYTPPVGSSLQRFMMFGGIYAWSTDDYGAEGNPIYDGAIVNSQVNLLDNDGQSVILHRRSYLAQPQSQARVFLTSVDRLGLWSGPWDLGEVDLDVRIKQVTGLVELQWVLNIEQMGVSTSNIKVSDAGGYLAWRVLTSTVPGE